MRNKFLLLLVTLVSLFTIHYSFFAEPVSAHCPLCVGGAAIGLSVARFFGIDDAITGLWLAALFGALSFWLDSYLSKRFAGRSSLFNKNFIRPIVYIAFFGLMVWSFYAFNDYMISKFQFYLLNKHAGQIAGVDKLTFGVILGGVLFYLVDVVDDLAIKKHGRVYFPFQRIIVSLGVILISSLILYLLINFYI